MIGRRRDVIWKAMNHIHFLAITPKFSLNFSKVCSFWWEKWENNIIREQNIIYDTAHSTEG